GFSTVQNTSVAISSGSSGKWFVPTDSLPSGWNSTIFDDSAWTSATMPLGFDTSTAGTPNANGFAILEKHSSSTVASTSDAENLLDNDSVTGTSYSAAVVNFVDPQNASAGHFGSDSPFGGNTSGDDNNFALEVHATVVIPTTGAWTFGVNSD